jgi:hypothetical protein
MSEWVHLIAGRPVTFTADLAQNGKLFIRANGRVVAAPLAPGEHERIFSIDGELLRLHRKQDGLELDVITPEVIDETEPQTAGPEIRESESIWHNHAFEPPPSVRIRGRIYLAALVLIFIVTVISAMRMQNFRERAQRAENYSVRLEPRPFAEPRRFARFEAASAILISGLTWTAFLSFLAMAGTGFLIKGFRWAPRVLETITWLMLAFLTLMMIRVDRVLHIQINSALEPVPAAQAIDQIHSGQLRTFVVIALIAGGLLQLISHRSIARSYDSESY